MAGFCGSTKQQPSEWFDPLGPNAQGQHTSTGGPEARGQIFGKLTGKYGQADEAATRAASATTAAAGNPLWGQSQRAIGDNLNGRNLAPNPYLTTAVQESRRAADTRLGATREQALADLAAQQASTRAASERNGVSFGTGAQQAQDAEKAAMLAAISRGEQSASADMNANEAGQYAENYARERGLQTSSAAMAPAAASGQAQLLQAVPGQYYGPLTQSAEIVRGLAGGGTPIQPTMYREPGVGNYIAQGVGALGSLAGGY